MFRLNNSLVSRRLKNTISKSKINKKDNPFEKKIIDQISQLGKFERDTSEHLNLVVKGDESGGPKGPEPTRYNDWEQKGRCIDF